MKQDLDFQPEVAAASLSHNHDARAEQSETAVPPSTPEFLYEPLGANSIRLIVLEPKRSSENESIVRCQLVPHTFASKPHYDALSYTWGDEEPSMVIYVNDALLRIRSNLYWALFHFRQDKPRQLWADAICIDQSNVGERNIQVALMDIIYTRASSVRIWLGSPLSKLNQTIGMSEKWLSRYPVFVAPRILHLSYWSRAWIIQEVGLSSDLTIHIGDTSLDWNIFIGNIQDKRDSAKKRQVLKLDKKRRGRHDRNPLEELLDDFQDCQCKDRKDKIFAFIGLAHDSNDLVKADYSKSTFELYTNLIEFFCQRKLLNNGSTNCIDRAMRLIKFSQLVHRLLDNVNSSGTRISQSIFHVWGAVGASILHVGPSYDSLFSSPNVERQWKQSFKTTYYNRPEQIAHLRKSYEAYYYVLYKMEEKHTKKFCAINPQNQYSKAVDTRDPWNPNADTWDRDQLDNEADRDVEDLPGIELDEKVQDGPHLFLGTNYCMGLAPAQVREGDVLCHFWNCDVVALLRKENEVPDTDTNTNAQSPIYRIIGKVSLSTGTIESGLRPIYESWVKPVEGAHIMQIQLDINTLHMLTR